MKYVLYQNIDNFLMFNLISLYISIKLSDNKVMALTVFPLLQIY